MRYITEQSKSYSSLDNLREDLAFQNVQETRPFRLSEMSLTSQGTVEVMGLGEFPLSEIALTDALRRGGLQMSCCQTFFQEGQTILDEAIVNAANAFYRHASSATSQIKLITRSDKAGGRIVLGIPSRQYALFTHEEAVEKILNTLPFELRLTRANVYPQFMEVAFTHPTDVVKDRLGKIVEVGLNFFNSQGTRTCSLTAAAFSFRLVCTNGATAKQKMFSVRYAHKGNFGNSLRFAMDTKDIFERFALLMQELPRLGDIPVTEKLLTQIKPELSEAISSKEAEDFVTATRFPYETVSDLWNRVTELPHRIENPDTRLKLEQLGFRILTMHLGAN